MYLFLVRFSGLGPLYLTDIASRSHQTHLRSVHSKLYHLRRIRLSIEAVTCSHLVPLGADFLQPSVTSPLLRLSSAV